MARDLVVRGAQTSPELVGSILQAAVHTWQPSMAGWALVLEAPDDAGKNPLQRAQASEGAEMIALLQARGATG